MAESEFEKLVSRAKGFGIDLNIVMAELDRRIEARQTSIAKNIIDQIPSIKPDINAIVQEVKEKVQTADLDIDSIVAKILEKIPDTGEVERQRVRTEVFAELKDFMEKLNQRIPGMVKPIMDQYLGAELSKTAQAVRDEMNGRMEEIASKFQGTGNGTGAGGGGGKWGGIPWEQLTPLMEKMIGGGQDPFAGLDRILELREKLSLLDPPSPDVNQQFRSASASFLEGIKLGSKVKGSPVDSKKLSGPAGGPSKSQAKPTTLHPAVKNL